MFWSVALGFLLQMLKIVQDGDLRIMSVNWMDWIGYIRSWIKRGSSRDRLIRDLYREIRYEPAPFPSPVKVRQLTLEEFQQFRSKIDPLSDEEIAGELRKAEEENDRKSDEFFKKGGGFRPPNSIVRV